MRNPFKVGGWYGMDEDGFSFDQAPECGVYIPDKEAARVLFREKVRRLATESSGRDVP